MPVAPSTPVRRQPHTPTAPQEQIRTPYFYRRSKPELTDIKILVDLIKQNLTETDVKDNMATVYAIKARDTDMTKVGRTGTAEVCRAEQHLKNCKIELHKMYQHPGFQGAQRAEQIIHKLLKAFNFWLHGCLCGKADDHTEWFAKPFFDVVAILQLVCNWIQYQQPYQVVIDEKFLEKGETTRKTTIALRAEWSESLDQWYETQFTESPLDWKEFFLRDINSWRDYQIHLPASQRPQYELVHTPATQVSKSSATKVHRPTGCFNLSSPTGTHQHTEFYQQRSETKNVHYPDGTNVSVSKSEQKLIIEDVHTSNNMTSMESHQSNFDTTPCPSPTKNGDDERKAVPKSDHNEERDRKRYNSSNDCATHDDLPGPTSTHNISFASIPDRTLDPKRTPEQGSESKPSDNSKREGTTDGDHSVNGASTADDPSFTPKEMTRSPTLQERMAHIGGGMTKFIEMVEKVMKINKDKKGNKDKEENLEDSSKGDIGPKPVEDIKPKPPAPTEVTPRRNPERSARGPRFKYSA